MSTFDFTELKTWGGEPVARRIADAKPRRRLVVTGTIGRTTDAWIGGTHCLRSVLDDGSGEIDLVFLGRARVPGLEAGARCTIEGTVLADGGSRVVVWNPLYRIEVSKG